MNVLIAIPTYENIMPQTYRSIWQLDKGGHDVDFEFVKGYDVATARNHIGNMAKDRNVDYLLMVDNDIVLPKDALTRLLSHGLDVCLGFYAHRDWDNVFRGLTCIGKLKDKDGNDYFSFPRESLYTKEEVLGMAQAPVHVHGGGMGCALIKGDVFRRVKFPYFDWVNYESNQLLSEDLFFCLRCRDAGIRIHADPAVRCGHLFRFVQKLD